ncbi:MAG: HAD-IC family P-type ATPase [Patescibacteria group bacterium]|nr:HAD-IC family P-type ATPase [Patescibacteria group bacterium]
MSEQEVFRKLSANINGLSGREAKKRLRHFGANEPVAKKKKSQVLLFLQQFASPLVYLLLASATITYILGKLLDTWVILIIVIANAVIGFIQEQKAEKSLEALKRLVSLKAKVIRDHEENEIPALDLVPGDIVILEAGAKVPADLRLLKAQNLKIDESALTGESAPVQKRIFKLDQSTILANRINMAYASTIVVAGHGLGIVVETASKTEIGKIAQDVSTIKEEKTPLHRRLEKFSTYLLVITIAVCFLIFVLGLLRGQQVIEMFLTSVAAAVAVIPEGLPAVITITLALGVRRMAEKNAIVRKLQAVETLGCITAISSDKTGTLTYNQMTAEKIYLPGKFLTVSGKGYAPDGKFFNNNREINPAKISDLKQSLLISILCNDASLIKEKNQWQISGDPTEGALVTLAAKAKIFKDRANQRYRRLDEIPFDSEIAYMSTLNTWEKAKNIIAAKGTLEKILSFSSHALVNGQIKKINSLSKKKILLEAHQQASEGYRIIACSYRIVSKSVQKLATREMSSMIFLGFFCLDDPPRKEVSLAMDKCRRAGIKPLMITGDYPATALAIAKRIGMVDQKEQHVLTENEVDKMTLPQLAREAKYTFIFARITPRSKLKIVEALQKNGEIVAVTGDGVNDAPVLKKSNVGIAMGIGGTDVAREASDVVLMDNNFSTIILAIEEGRTIFLNIRRVIFYLLSTNAGEVLILVTSLLIGLPLPLTAVQILWINLLTDTSSAVSLSMEPKHIDVTKRSPRSMKEEILDKVTYWRVLLVAITMTIITIIFYWQALASGHSLEYARSIAFITMAVLHILHVLNARSMKTSIFKIKLFSNVYIYYAMLSSAILAVLTTQWLPLQKLFHTEPLPPTEWMKIILVGFVIILVVELDKYIRNRVK